MRWCVIEKIELENIKIFFSNTPPQVNLRRFKTPRQTVPTKASTFNPLLTL